MLTEAIVIKKTPTREHDLLVTLYSRESGKLNALAKGAMRSSSIQALQLDPGNQIRCDLVAGRSGMPIITGAQSGKCLSRAKASPPIWAAVQFFLQVIDVAVFDQERDEGLWDCLNGILLGLEDAKPADLLHSFRKHQLSLLSVLGYGGTAVTAGRSVGRTEIDDRFEQIANRKLQSLDLFYELAR